MKSFFKKFFLVVLVIFIAIQFFKPTKNTNSVKSLHGINLKYAVPADVDAILKTSCYDCHSNNTNYPWYSNIQPVALYLANHVKDGKKHLNFDEFISYSIARQYRKLEEISIEIQDGEMPMFSYTLIHKNAQLNDLQKRAVYAWVTQCRDSVKAQYPADSLIRKPKVKEG